MSLRDHRLADKLRRWSAAHHRAASRPSWHDRALTRLLGQAGAAERVQGGVEAASEPLQAVCRCGAAITLVEPYVRQEWRDADHHAHCPGTTRAHAPQESRR